MIADHEPRLHALSVSPPRAGSGAIVTFTFRLRNHGCRATAPAVIRFALDAALEPLDALEHRLPAAASGALLTASIRARVRTGLDDRSRLRAQALLTIVQPDANAVSPSAMEPMATNTCVVVVRTKARFDGDASGTSVERIDVEHVRVRAWTVNEGDGPANDVTLALGVPRGCARDDGDGPASAGAARLAPGERLDVEMHARIVEPGNEILADDARVEHAGARAVHLTRSRALALEADVGQPLIAVASGAGLAAVTIAIENSGWVDARDVTFAVDVSEGLRVLAATFALDGIEIPLRPSRANERVVAAVVRAPGGFEVKFARIAARSRARLTFDVRAPLDGSAGTLTVRHAGHTTRADICVPPIADIRLRVVDRPRSIACDSPAALSVELINAGRTAHAIVLELDGPHVRGEVVRLTLKHRGLAIVRLPFVATSVEDAAPIVDSVVASVRARIAGEEVARQAVTLVVRGSEPRAREAACPRVDEGAGDTTTVGPPEDLDDADRAAARTASPADFVLSAKQSVPCGMRLDVRAALRAHRNIEELTLRVPEVGGCVYVPGSLTVDGRAIAERTDGGAANGTLTLGAIAAHTFIELAWAIVPTALPSDGHLTLAADVEADGIACDVAPVCVAVEDRLPFARWSPVESYFIDASPVDPSNSAPMNDAVANARAAESVAEATIETGLVSADAAPAAAPERTMYAPSIVLFGDDAWREETRRLLERSDETGLLGHIFAVRALFPQRVDDGGAAVADALANARSALRDVFDRLFVKIRIPGFPVAADDIEDPALREALRATFAAIVSSSGEDRGDEPTSPPQLSGNGRHALRRVGISAPHAREALAVLATAPRGAPAVLRRIIALIPTSSDIGVENDRNAGTHAAELALINFLRELDAALAAFLDAPAHAFDDALTSGTYPRLDATRAALIASLDERTADTAGW